MLRVAMRPIVMRPVVRVLLMHTVLCAACLSVCLSVYLPLRWTHLDTEGLPPTVHILFIANDRYETTT